MKKIDLVQGSKEWLEYRRSRVMASDIPVILNVSPYKKRHQLLGEKKYGPKEISDFTKKIFQDGHDWEEVVRDHLFKQGKVFTPCVVQSQDNDRFAASLDGLSEDETQILEVKSTSKQEIIDRVKSGDIPPEYYHQIQFQLFCTGLQSCLLVVVKDGEMVSTIVETQTPLEHSITYSKASEFLNEMDFSSESHLMLPEWNELVHLKNVSQEVNLRLKQIEDRVKELSTKLLQTYGASHLEGNGIRVQKVERSGAVDYSKIPELASVDLEKYRKRSTTYVKCDLLKPQKGDHNESITNQPE